ncbi:hypothetical protein JET18_10250 [Chryseobacterium sp. L7]|uniref:Uncharacterized protein n=1 Tax=Chryseobacterium endalhagicum TaxID=2797638 RepID=A0ABS1QFW7_9FLAO|nr:hypothetical protein [Chryseobacterium endalhagicum]MBL1221222.1 hypothetical protein [Chryseobacterium endalhagicum]
MKILLFPFLLISISLSAQKEDKRAPLAKEDSPKISYFKDLKELPVKTEKEEKDPYKMLTVIPKDTSAYIALKEAKKDDSKYRILNAITPEKTAPEPKKAEPSK